MRWFVKQCIQGCRFSVFTQYYNSKKGDMIFRTLSKELNVKGNSCDGFEAYVKYMSDEKEPIGNKRNSVFDDHREIDEKEKKNL